MKRIAEAKTVFENVLKLNPERPIALLNLGYANVLTNNLPQGEKLYDQALALDPDYEQALVNKAALLIFQGKKVE
ncbi:MAG: tetratricopeptide repeat protein, partial [Saprospiraceae bacterium]|nr:tetratricopeptide repeat protein [Saprospiraceae bacterium]